MGMPMVSADKAGPEWTSRSPSLSCLSGPTRGFGLGGGTCVSGLRQEEKTEKEEELEDWTEMILFVHMCCFFFFSFLCHVAHSGRGRYLLHLRLIHPCMCVCWPIKLLAAHASMSLFL